MTDIFTWEIRDLNRYLDTGAVYSIEWTLKAERSVENVVVFDAQQQGVTGLGAPDPNNFIPYDSLTKEDTIQWLQAILGESDIEETKATLVQQLNELENPTKGRGIPWPQTPRPEGHPDATWNTETSTWDVIIDKSEDEGKAWHPDQEPLV